MINLTPTIKPTHKQHLAYQLLWDNITRFILFGGGAEGGKSWLGAEWLLTNCYRYPGTKWFIGRNELTRLLASSYQTFLKVCEYHHIPRDDWSYNGQYHFIQFKNGSRIDLLDLVLTPKDPMYQRYGSTEYTGGWIEEAGEVHFLAFDVLKSRVGRWKNQEYNLFPKVLLTCNPEQNWLYRVFYKPWRIGTLEKGYAFIQSLYKDNPYTAKEAELRLEEIKDPTLRARLKMGLWEYSSAENNLLTYDAIVDLFTNTLEENPNAERWLSADVARYGSDKVVIGNWKDYDLYKIAWKQDRSITQTAEDIKLELTNERIPYSHAIADDDGVGGGVVDMAKGIKGFVGNASALPVKQINIIQGDRREERKENYRNLRSQCAFMLAEKIMSHNMRISAKIDETTKEMIIEELQQLKKKLTPIETALQIAPKDEMKEALGRSPDFMDMMLMRMYFELDRPTVVYQQTEFGGALPYIPNIG